MQTIHFIGIGGAGMSGIARIMLELGYRITGSDLNASAATERLTALGATCYNKHRAENVGGADLVVVSTAIPPDNEELVEARVRGLPVLQRGEMLARLMQRQKGVAVAGMHGKTTTTSMMAMALEKNGLDPTVIVGGELTDFGGNAKLGRGKYLVAEADESDGSFLKLKPYVGVVTNIDDDHLDYYKKFENIILAYREYLDRIPVDGLAVVCLDDPWLRDMMKNYGRPVESYALNNFAADYTVQNVRLNGTATAGEVYYHGRRLGLLELAVPGRHNLANALAVVAAGRFVGLEFADIATALKSFAGAGRRFQLIGEIDGIKVVDDYAHHPAEIKATLLAARQTGPQRLICVFQPHRYTRTAILQDRFGEAFDDADLVVISDIYSAGEQPITGVSARLIVSAVRDYGRCAVIYRGTQDEVVEYLAAEATPGDLIITMGAGDIWKAGVELVRRKRK